uniref:RNA polymerase II elongation factor ELL N-terminal domain-containing protein n=1 Tax=Neolamprologus brichardi TaxID=32507 RepID=A0A3Q4H330_NEOBR
MASLRQEHQYGLSCGKNNKNSPNRTLYHVKLTDTAIRALEAYQNLKVPLWFVCFLFVCLGVNSCVKVSLLSSF